MTKQKKIAIYGKGGIGKSTTVANVAASFADDNKKVMVIGCDPKADTTRTIVGKRIPTILNTLKKNKNPNKADVVFNGYKNIICVESGGPEPGVGCAGRGVIVAMNFLEKLDIFNNNNNANTDNIKETDNIDVTIYDVLGDVVCGGFAVPLKEDYADEVFIVSSGEYMSLYAANNIAKGIKKLNAKLSGIICNCKGIENEIAIVNSFAEKINTKVIGIIPRSQLIQDSEIDAKTVVEKYPNSEESKNYKILAEAILENNSYSAPNPMENEKFEEFFKNFIK
ncbi:MAG: Ni-sirohydrochlorin a,c-diamide reductive cyclase ATP-dependent reductase subunit [Methanobrevibacter sp.]|jgi:nitrogenase iron protein NifH|nr:Ni-sirohydrochlorin a,c-diamide reductive cyclase ATP-dependent reductase subunit [Methanobrevibacter sp.]